MTTTSGGSDRPETAETPSPRCRPPRWSGALKPEPFRPPQRAAFLDGFSLHAGVRIHANDRDGRERPCRYVLLPPLALHRLCRGEDGGLVYRMKRPRGGSYLLVLTGDELLAQLATLLVPPVAPSPDYDVADPVLP